MFRRLIRARRRVPVQSAGHESSDRSEPKDGEPTPDVYHACIGSDGPIPLFIEDLSRLKRPRIFSSDVFRQRARNLVSHVSQEERNATQAWSRLQQLYSVFQAIQAQNESMDGDDEDAVLTSILANGDGNDTILNDFHELTSALPEGFTPQMFAELGNALFNEMVTTQPPRPGDASPTSSTGSISRQSFESLGDRMFAQSSTSSSAIVSLTVSA